MARTGRWLRVLLVLLLLALLGVAGWRLSVYFRVQGHDRAARAAVELRDFAEARRQLDARLRLSSDADALLLAAQVARRDGDFLKASEFLESARKAHALPESIAQEESLLALQMGRLEEADTYDRLCFSDPDGPHVVLALEALITGYLTALHLPRAHRAIELWLAHRSSPPEQTQGLIWRGDVAIRRGDADNALADYRRALELSPTSDLARRRVAEILVRSDPREALTHLDQLRQRDPDDRKLRFLVARARRALGEHEEAQRVLDKLLAESPTDPTPILLERGQVALDLRQLSDAENWFRSAWQLAPHLRDTNQAMANCLRLAGKADEAQGFQERVTQIDAHLQKQIDTLLGTPKKTLP